MILLHAALQAMRYTAKTTIAMSFLSSYSEITCWPNRGSAQMSSLHCVAEDPKLEGTHQLMLRRSAQPIFIHTRRKLSFDSNTCHRRPFFQNQASNEAFTGPEGMSEIQMQEPQTTLAMIERL